MGWKLLIWIFLILIAIAAIYDWWKNRKKKKSHIVVAILCAASVVSLVILRLLASSEINKMSKASESLFGAEKIAEAMDEYAEFLTETNRDIKTVLIVGSDARPDTDNSNYRTDTIYIASIDNDTKNVYFYTLPRDTVVKYSANVSDTCKLNEVANITGDGMQGLVNAIRLNYGIDIDEYVQVTWESVINFIDIYYPDGYSVELNEIELLGLNQIIPNQNLDFGRDASENLILGSDETALGQKELNYISDYINYILIKADDGNWYSLAGQKIYDKGGNFLNVNGEILNDTDGEPIKIFSEIPDEIPEENDENYTDYKIWASYYFDEKNEFGYFENGSIQVVKAYGENVTYHYQEVNDTEHGDFTEGRSAMLYDVNYNCACLLEKTTFYKKFSAEGNTYTLNGIQMLAYMRLRHAYSNQDVQRSKNTKEIIVEIGTNLFKDASNYISSEKVEEFSELCALSSAFVSSYDSLNDVLQDFMFKGIYAEKAVNGIDEKGVIPWDTKNYEGENGEITGVYMSLAEQARELIYEENLTD